MGKYIVKLVDDRDDNKTYYMEWSTVVDAPVTYGMTLEEFTKHYQNQYGEYSIHELPSRLERVDKDGCSSRLDSLEDLLKYNHAKEDGGTATLYEIIDHYCKLC